MTNDIINISAYKFVQLSSEKLVPYQEQLKETAQNLGIKGSILLSLEGINLFLAASAESIQSFTDYLSRYTEFSDLWIKKSISDNIPFKRLRVRIKDEIIAMKVTGIAPAQKTAAYITPAELKKWYQANKDMIVLDTRNTYEYEIGTFEGALTLEMETFREFPQALAALPAEAKKKPVVTFCTGGIRCEKAAAYLLEQGFEQVWQLEGGILNYFDQCGAEHFQGQCFVFDERVAVEPQDH